MNDEEGSARWDIYGYVYEYVQTGNQAFRVNKLEEVGVFHLERSVNFCTLLTHY